MYALYLSTSTYRSNVQYLSIHLSSDFCLNCVQIRYTSLANKCAD